MRLLVRWLTDHTDFERAYLAIDEENVASHGVAKAVNARPTERYLNDDRRPNIRYAIDLPDAAGPERIFVRSSWESAAPNVRRYR